MSLVRALFAEQLKMKRTLALLLAPLIPAVIVLLEIGMIWQRQDMYRKQLGLNAWGFYTNQTLFLWLLLMFPLFITLETALLAGLEHSNQQWKNLFALPIARWSIYLAKQIAGIAIIGISLAALYVYIMAGGIALRYLTPGMGFESTAPWGLFLHRIFLVFLASWLMISIHTWVAMRWPNFVLPIAVGIVAMIVAFLLIQGDYNPWYPWTMPALVADAVSNGKMPLQELLTGSMGGLGVALLGCWDVTRRDVL
jgi:lantibiotic transport system permease protein